MCRSSASSKMTVIRDKADWWRSGFANRHLLLFQLIKFIFLLLLCF